MKNSVNMFPLWVISLFLFLSSTACKKNNDRVPTVAVDEYLNLNLPEYFNLNAINNWVYYNYAGNKGIIVVRKSNTEFAAYERTCTFDPNVSASIVEGITNDIFAIDSICGSKFSLLDGSIVNGPAGQPLLQYRTQLLSNNILHIYN
ncbi:MAG: hypothetical protein IPJ86_08905 [Bacteroidetes bacterium]|nr:hypothetical protein [Bacteroidota bacterium]